VYGCWTFGFSFVEYGSRTDWTDNLDEFVEFFSVCEVTGRGKGKDVKIQLVFSEDGESDRRVLTECSRKASNLEYGAKPRSEGNARLPSCRRCTRWKMKK
jgi:hypothetical protein